LDDLFPGVDAQSEPAERHREASEHLWNFFVFPCVIGFAFLKMKFYNNSVAKSFKDKVFQKRETSAKGEDNGGNDRTWC
jgi:hypothetical protein